VSQRISIGFDGLGVQAQLRDTPCARGLYEALPLDARVRTWGEEITFPIGLALPTGEALRSEMAVGEIACWPAGEAFCLFFGPTPASDADGTPRAASDVEPLGHVLGDVKPLRAIRAGGRVMLVRASGEPRHSEGT